MKRSLIVLLASIVFLFSFAACSNNAGEPPTNPGTGTEGTNSTAEAGKENVESEPKKERTIVLSTIGGYYSTALKEVAAEYTKLKPETKVEINIIADNSAYKTNFDAKMNAGREEAPDIIHTNLVGDLTENIGKGWILKLNDFVNEPNPYNGDAKVFDAIDPSYHQFSFDREGNIGNLTFDLVGTGFYYNKDLFDKHGVSEPKTWEELFQAGDKLKAEGVTPIAMPIDFLGLIWGAFVDWTARDMYKEVLILPGDARYDDKIHKQNIAIAEADSNDPGFDFGAVTDPDKKLLAWKNKTYDNQGPEELKYWSVLKTLSQYFQSGYGTATTTDAYQLFVSGQAAIYYSGSWDVGTLLTDQKKLGDKGFAWGTFKFPEFAEPDPLFPGKPRGILVPGHLLGIADKQDPDLADRAKDFLKYLYSKDVAQKVMQRTLEVGEFVQGPSLIEGVTLPPEVNAYLEGFKVAGNKSDIADSLTTSRTTDQQAAFTGNILDYFNGKITVEQFLENKAKFVDQFNQKDMNENKYDADPKTIP